MLTKHAESDAIVGRGTVERRLSYDIVSRGTGYESLQVSKRITKALQFLLKVVAPCITFCFKFARYG